MHIFENIIDVKNFLKEKTDSGNSIGFVPTMGALHEGHSSLIKLANKENDITVCSIFVNPKQFNNKEDLDKYPRTLTNDINILSKLNCDVVFTPSTEEMYSEPIKENFDLGELENILEGEFRKGHFKGVAIVVKRLLDIILPDKAYFGKKDYQQLLIVKKLVKLEKMPVEIIACDTVRENDGLAMSSRNKRLNSSQRKEAATIYQTLLKVEKLCKEKTLSLENIKKRVYDDINSLSTIELEYFEILNPENLKPLESVNTGKKAIACIAVYAGSVRLIDNIIFNY